MSADEIKKTPDVEAAAEPEKTEAEAAEKTEAEAAEKKPAAKKPAAKKPAAKADDKAADAKAAKKPAAKKPAAKKPPPRPTDEKAAKPAAKKPAAKKAAPAKAEKAAPKKAAKKPAAGKAEAPAPKAERPPKPEPAAKVADEARKGAAGVATFVDAAGKEVETRKLADDRFAVPADVNTLHLVVRAEQAARRSRHRVDQDARRGQRLHRQAVPPEGHGPRPRRQRQVADPHRRRHRLRPASAQLRHQDQQEGHPQGARHGAERPGRQRPRVRGRRPRARPSRAPRTVEQFLVNLDCAAPVLVVTHDEPVVTKSVRNLPYAEATEVAALSTEQVLRARSLVLTEKAFAALNEA